MRKYVGAGRYVPGVPARDLTEQEYQAAIKAGLIVEGQPAAKLWKKEKDKSERGGEE